MDRMGRRLIGLACIGILAGTLVGCGSTPSPSAPSAPASSGSAPSVSTTSGAAQSQGSGTANVAYAGSLQLLDDKTVGPGFEKATGFSYEGRGGGSIGLSNEIAAGEITPNVFESVGAGPIQPLMPKLTSWYVQLASSPIVVAYNPKTRFGSRLAAIAKGQKPIADLFSLMEQPGFLLGRTNPRTDPQGQAFYEMVELAQSQLHLPAGTVTKVLGSIDNPSQVFAETALESRLQSGQLDAASAFLSQAIQLHLPYITLPAGMNFGNPALASQYATASLDLGKGNVVHGVPLVIDITTIGSQDAQAADSFVAYSLSKAGQQALQAGGYELLQPTVFGNRSAVPAGVLKDLSRS